MLLRSPATESISIFMFYTSLSLPFKKNTGFYNGPPFISFIDTIPHHTLDSDSSDYDFTPSEVVLTLLVFLLQYHSYYGLGNRFVSSRRMSYQHKEFSLGVDKLWHILNQSNTINLQNHNWIFPYFSVTFVFCLSNWS